MTIDTVTTVRSEQPNGFGRDGRATPDRRGDGLIAAARALAPRIRAMSDTIEQERRLPATLVDALAEAGVFSLCLPRSLGGSGLDPLTAARIVEALAAADGSVGWCVMLAAQVAIAAGFLPPAAAREVFAAGPRTMLAGVARPVGQAVPVDGGYRVTGRWPFASGSSHATWFAGECVVFDPGVPGMRDQRGERIVRTVFFPREVCTVHDTWHTLGLRGTASHDFSVDNVFVPAERTYRPHVDPPRRPGAIYRHSALWFMGHGAHALGIAQAAIDTVAAVVPSKRYTSGQGTLREQPHIQVSMAEAQVLVASARDHLYGAGARLYAAAGAGEEPAPLHGAQVRLATSHAVRSAVQAVELMMTVAGTTAVVGHGPLERQFRDIHTAAAHVMVGRATYEAAGRVALGLEANAPFF